MNQFKAIVLTNAELLSHFQTRYFHLEIEATGITANCHPGQFFMLGGNGTCMLRRPISIHNLKQPDKVQFLYAVPVEADNLPRSAGKGTGCLSRLKTGDSLDVIGPLGNGFTIDDSAGKIMIVAGGIGIAPLKYLANYASDTGKDVILLMGARTGALLYPVNALSPLYQTIICTDDGSAGKKSSVIELIPEYLKQVDQVFVCGPQPMYEALETAMKQWATEKPVQISLEVRMGCGFGVCYGCSIKTAHGIKTVCKDGPVFNIKDIIWQEVKI